MTNVIWQVQEGQLEQGRGKEVEADKGGTSSLGAWQGRGVSSRQLSGRLGANGPGGQLIGRGLI